MGIRMPDQIDMEIPVHANWQLASIILGLKINFIVLLITYIKPFLSFSFPLSLV